jgi:hypothetical protein
MKAGIVEPEGTTISMQRLGKRVPTATNTHAGIKLLDAVFSMRSVSYQILNM